MSKMIRDRIIALRTRKAWSQAHLARAAAIGQSTLHGYEAGTRRVEGMSLDVAMRLARALDVDMNYLCGFYEDDHRPLR